MQSHRKQQQLNEAFNEAASKNNLRKMQKLLESGAQASSPQGTKALINACVNNDANMIHQLLSAGALKGVDQKTVDYTWETLERKKKYTSEKEMPALLEIEQKIQQEIGPQRI